MDFKNEKIERLLRKVGSMADEMGVDCYVVGGFVRDLLLGKANDDIDFVVVGSGLELAKRLGERCDSEVCLYESYGTAKVKVDGYDLEFVGARKEFYHRESRNPIVEDGTLEDDLSRRDFTINAIAICVNEDRFGELIDKYNGCEDLRRRVIRCVGDAEERFSEDPLRMLRCIRFASRLGFSIEDDTYLAIIVNAERIEIIVKERITEELMKMMSCRKPDKAFMLLHVFGLLERFIPSFYCREDRNFIIKYLLLLKEVSNKTDDVWVRWAVLFSPLTSLNIEESFRKMGMPLDSRLNKVIKLASSLPDRLESFIKIGYNISDLRHFLYETGDYLEDILKIGESMLTVNYRKNTDIMEKFEKLKGDLTELDRREQLSNFSLSIDGHDIMEILDISSGKEVGIHKATVINAILSGEVRNNKEEITEFLRRIRHDNVKQN